MMKQDMCNLLPSPRWGSLILLKFSVKDKVTSLPDTPEGVMPLSGLRAAKGDTSNKMSNYFALKQCIGSPLLWMNLNGSIIEVYHQPSTIQSCSLDSLVLASQGIFRFFSPPHLLPFDLSMLELLLTFGMLLFQAVSE